MIPATAEILKDALVQQERKRDPVLNEVCSDLETLLLDLSNLRKTRGQKDPYLMRDLTETVQALVQEIRSRIARVN